MRWMPRLFPFAWTLFLVFLVVPLSIPFGFVYLILSRFRNWLFDHNIIQTHSLATGVISVGNLTAGGTGKTPVVDWIIDFFEQQNIQAAVVSRNWKARLQSTARIDLLSVPKPAEFYGDEPVWLQKRHPNLSVWVGPNKLKTAQLLMSRENPDVIVMDDGFQHRKLGRDLDIVVMDAMAKKMAYWPFPIGEAREGVDSLDRADIVILTNCHLATPDQISNIRSKLPKHLLIAEAELKLKGLRRLHTQDYFPPEDFKSKNVVAFCGIGNPKRFHKTLTQDCALDLIAFRSFSDHQRYDAQTIKDIETWAASHQAEALFTTEKDAVKLEEQGGFLTNNVFVVEMQLSFLSPIEPIRHALKDMVNRKS